MANESLFQSPIYGRYKNKQTTDDINSAGGVAYQFTPFHELCQFVATGVLRDGYYSKAEEQLTRFMELTDDLKVASNEQLAKLAVWGRRSAFMKDTPAAVVMALLKRRAMPLFHKVFDRVIDNGKMIRNVFQMLRSGVFGRKSMSYSIQRAFCRWFNTAPVTAILAGTVGNSPSLRDVIRCARPTPSTPERDALFAWINGKDTDRHRKHFPEELKALLAFREAVTEGQQVEALSNTAYLRWELLSDAAKGTEAWTAIASTMGHQALRMNLNTLTRHGVLKSQQMVNYVAERLRNPEEVRRARQWPVQYFSAYMNADGLPNSIKQALSAAAEIACGNIPELPGPLVIGVDTSGSMCSSITGRYSADNASKVTCRDAAAVFAAALLKKNPDSLVVPFDTGVHMLDLDAGDTILSVSSKLSKLGGGGTNCSLPLQYANTKMSGQAYAGCVMLSDNESWVGSGSRITGQMSEWEVFRKNQQKLGVYKNPKMLNVNFQPNGTTQAIDRKDIMNVGGFSDSTFNIISGWMFDRAGAFVAQVEATTL